MPAQKSYSKVIEMILRLTDEDVLGHTLSEAPIA